MKRAISVGLIVVVVSQAIWARGHGLPVDVNLGNGSHQNFPHGQNGSNGVFVGDRGQDGHHNHHGHGGNGGNGGYGTVRGGDGGNGGNSYSLEGH